MNMFMERIVCLMEPNLMEGPNQADQWGTVDAPIRRLQAAFDWISTPDGLGGNIIDIGILMKQGLAVEGNVSIW